MMVVCCLGDASGASQWLSSSEELIDEERSGIACSHPMHHVNNRRSGKVPWAQHTI